jgi:acyl dehydratase
VLTLGTIMTSPGFEPVALSAPIFRGDTLPTESEFVDARASTSRPNADLEHRVDATLTRSQQRGVASGLLSLRHPGDAPC